MVEFSSVASLASLFVTAQSVSNATQDREAVEAAHDGNGDENGSEAATAGQQSRMNTNDKLDRLIAIQEKNKATPGDKDAYATAVLELGNGETGLITVEPDSGWHLRVKRVHFDRRDDHIYEINVGGDVTSISHRAIYSSPRTVTQSDRVVATVTNESGSSSVVDFEIEAWAEQPGKV